MNDRTDVLSGREQSPREAVMQEFRRVAKGLITVARRRGIGYLGYLAMGVAVPEMLYRFAWGPQAPRPVRHLFQAVIRATGRRLSEEQLQAIDLLPAGSVRSVTSTACAADVLSLMNRAHHAGVTGLATGFDRVVQVDGQPRFASLPHAKAFTRRGVLYCASRDADRLAYNRRFDVELMTEERARTSLADASSRVPHAYRDYAPIDFGHGVTSGLIASTDSGTGRWQYFNLPIVTPLVEDKRVLDLGCHNGALSLMMLRAGAREVLGVEVSPEIADWARLNGEILSWRDVRPYAFRVLTDDMRVFLRRDLGAFDVVTAFCSLYYLPAQDMAAVVRRAAGFGAILILQANDGIQGDLPARTSDLERLMVENGYPAPVVHAAAGFARPILVGRPARDASGRVT
jgi:SAM-dependent methyltransferase